MLVSKNQKRNTDNHLDYCLAITYPLMSISKVNMEARYHCGNEPAFSTPPPYFELHIIGTN